MSCGEVEASTERSWPSAAGRSQQVRVAPRKQENIGRRLGRPGRFLTMEGHPGRPCRRASAWPAKSSPPRSRCRACCTADPSRSHPTLGSLCPKRWIKCVVPGGGEALGSERRNLLLRLR